MSVLSIAACILPFSGCGKTVGKVHNKGVKSGAVRNLTENISKNDSGSKAADKEFKAAAASFSADLFKYNYSNGKTTLVSPLSVLTALALVQNGAEGETLVQLERALGGLDRDALNKYMRAYCDFLSAGDELKIKSQIPSGRTAALKQSRRFCKRRWIATLRRFSPPRCRAKRPSAASTHGLRKTLTA